MLLSPTDIADELIDEMDAEDTISRRANMWDNMWRSLEEVFDEPIPY